MEFLCEFLLERQCVRTPMAPWYCPCRAPWGLGSLALDSSTSTESKSFCSKAGWLLPRRQAFTQDTPGAQMHAPARTDETSSVKAAHVLSISMATLASRSYQWASSLPLPRPTLLPDPAFPECAFTISLPIPFSDDMDTVFFQTVRLCLFSQRLRALTSLTSRVPKQVTKPLSESVPLSSCVNSTYTSRQCCIKWVNII